MENKIKGTTKLNINCELIYANDQEKYKNLTAGPGGPGEPLGPTGP